MDPQVFSSDCSCWETPRILWNPLNDEFGFDLDAAASDANHRCKPYLTEADDALSMADWPGTSIWLNPPYGKGKVLHNWLNKVVEQIKLRPRVIVTLTAARTDTVWFQDMIWPNATEIRFIRGRILFEIDGKPIQHYDKRSGKWKDSPATFPSVLSIFRSYHDTVTGEVTIPHHTMVCCIRKDNPR